MNTRFKKIAPFLVLNAVGLVTIIWLLITKDVVSQEGIISRDKREGFTLTSPILDYENINQNTSTVISYKAVNKEVDTLIEKYSIGKASVYYRDLNNGQWSGINEKDFFAPASLMKTPLLIAFLKNSERTPGLLEKQVVAEQVYFDYSIKQNFDLKTKIEKGKTYTLKQVAEIMIQDSDNVAALMLSKAIQEKDFNDIFKAVGVDIKEEGIDSDIRVKDFASLFRILYNASYLSRESSELALSILSGSNFDTGIISGVPKKTIVAHKYGERLLQDSSTGKVVQKQLHDCGIIYTKNPYILCVMTQGSDFEKQAKFIAGVSKFFYENTAK